MRIEPTKSHPLPESDSMRQAMLLQCCEDRLPGGFVAVENAASVSACLAIGPDAGIIAHEPRKSRLLSPSKLGTRHGTGSAKHPGRSRCPRWVKTDLAGRAASITSFASAVSVAGISSPIDFYLLQPLRSLAAGRRVESHHRRTRCRPRRGDEIIE